MAIVNFSVTAANTLMNSFGSLLDSSEVPGYLEIYKGEMDTSCENNNNSENLLGVIQCLSPASTSSINGSIQIKFSSDNKATSSGKATWARLFNGNNEALMDLDISTPEEKNRGLVILDRTDIVKGGAIIINSMVFSI